MTEPHFSYRDWIGGGGLPVECWPLSALTELELSIAEAVERQRLSGHNLLTALDWLDVVRAEVDARERLSWQDAAGLGHGAGVSGACP